MVNRSKWTRYWAKEHVCCYRCHHHHRHSHYRRWWWWWLCQHRCRLVDGINKVEAIKGQSNKFSEWIAGRRTLHKINILRCGGLTTSAAWALCRQQQPACHPLATSCCEKWAAKGEYLLRLCLRYLSGTASNIKFVMKSTCFMSHLWNFGLFFIDVDPGKARSKK